MGIPTRCVNGFFQQATGVKSVKDYKAVLETELAVIYRDKITREMRTVIT